MTGAVNVNARQHDGYTSVIIEFMAEPNASREFDIAIDNCKYITPRKQGVYDIDVHHYYIDVMGHTKVIEHSLDSDNFNHLIREMYPTILLEEMMKLYSESGESNIILTGPPGTGKTCFAKMMMASHAQLLGRDINVIYVKDRTLLQKDEFWAMMSSIHPDMMILDDLDDELRPRTEGRNDIVNNMLSYSDGIFDVDTKIIITTNLTDNVIDKALIRPGRCFDILSLPQLTLSQAQTIWTNTFNADIEEFTNRFGIESTQISQAALSSEHDRFLKSVTPSYLIDPSISIRKLVEDVKC